MPRNGELHHCVHACKGYCVNPDATIQKHSIPLSHSLNIAAIG